MSLLDDLLGQLAGGAPRGDADATRSDPAPADVSGSGTTAKVMAALLPVVLGRLASGQRGSAGPDQERGDAGGLGALLAQFQRAGFGEQVRSWVSAGRNAPIAPEGVEQVFGRQGVAEIARRAGVSEQDASRGLSQLIPEVVDHMTPQAELPDASSLLASAESLAKRLGA